MRAFQPRAGGTFYIANATSASTPVAVAADADAFLFYNSSATATAFVRLLNAASNNLTNDPGASAVVPTAGSSSPVGDTPVPPGQQLLFGVGQGHKRLSVIASAADGNLYVTPGVGL